MITAMCIFMPMVCMITTMSSSNFMKLYTIMSVIFLSIETNVRKIVPDRQKCCIYKIRKKELIKHENNSEWNDNILATHCKIIVPRFSHDFLIKLTISKPCKYISYLKYITLLSHIDHHSRKCTKKKYTNKHIKYCIENWLSRLIDNKSTMKWEENSKNKNKIDGNTDKKN